MSEDKHRKMVWFSTEIWYGFQLVYTKRNVKCPCGTGRPGCRRGLPSVSWFLHPHLSASRSNAQPIGWLILLAAPGCILKKKNNSLHLHYSKNTCHREADGNATYRRTLCTIIRYWDEKKIPEIVIHRQYEANYPTSGLIFNNRFGIRPKTSLWSPRSNRWLGYKKMWMLWGLDYHS